MSDYFTNFSLVLCLPDVAAQAYALELAQHARSIQQGDDKPNDFPASLLEVVEDWNFETDAHSSAKEWGIWLHSDSGGIEAVSAFIQHLLQKFDSTGQTGFQWSYDCSKPRVDAYGGGAAFITAKEIKTMSTSDWLHQQGQ